MNAELVERRDFTEEESQLKEAFSRVAMREADIVEIGIGTGEEYTQLAIRLSDGTMIGLDLAKPPVVVRPRTLSGETMDIHPGDALSPPRRPLAAASKLKHFPAFSDHQGECLYSPHAI